MAQGDIRHKSILFGCDNWGRVVDEKSPYKSKSGKGIEMVMYLIIPSNDLIDAYPEHLNPGMLNEITPWGRGRWVEYPTKWVVDKNPSRRNAIVRVECTFDGKETALTKRTEHLTKELDYYQKANERLELSNIADTETIEMLMKEKIAMAEQLNELVEKMPGGKRIMNKGDEDATKQS